jgi:hypothetical protein
MSPCWRQYGLLHAAPHSQICCQTNDLPSARKPDVASELWFRNLFQDCKTTDASNVALPVTYPLQRMLDATSSLQWHQTKRTAFSDRW